LVNEPKKPLIFGDLLKNTKFRLKFYNRGEGKLFGFNSFNCGKVSKLPKFDKKKIPSNLAFSTANGYFAYSKAT
jgi:hypothetical protein